MKMPRSAVIVSVVAMVVLVIVDLFVWSIPVLHYYFQSLHGLGAVLVCLFGAAILLNIILH